MTNTTAAQRRYDECDDPTCKCGGRVPKRVAPDAFVQHMTDGIAAFVTLTRDEDR